jgi:Raf kinase inhibitor-like YbhB/YbcL family protein
LALAWDHQEKARLIKTEGVAMTRPAIWIAALAASALGASAANAQSMSLASSDIKEGGTIANEQVFKGFGCTGGNVSPDLSWSGAPGGTKSFAVSIYDPDAPTGSGWWHWIIFNIPANTNSLSRNAGDPASLLAPEGSVQSKTDFGTQGYGGACPPIGDKPHRYQFTVFALDVEKLPLDVNASGAMVGFNLRQHTLGRAIITVFYSR